MTPPKKRARVTVTEAELTGRASDVVAITHAAPALEYVPSAAAVRIGDRVHYTHPVHGGPWHGVVIAALDGGYRVEVTKPNGADLVIDLDAPRTAALGSIDFL